MLSSKSRFTYCLTALTTPTRSVLVSFADARARRATFSGLVRGDLLGISIGYPRDRN